MDKPRMMQLSRPISIRFHPFDFDNKEHAIEKSEGGMKRKYLRGISSGIMKDGHGERMTLNCIESMMNQGKSGNVLLFAGLHGVNFIDDLGILADSEVVNKQDWITSYRLYDESDIGTVGKETVEKANKLWAQVNGLPPYKSPIQKGFSIEGIVPEDQILEKKIDEHGNWTNRVINDMILDGVVVVSRPAYTDSFVTAVHKCLGELQPIAKEKIKERFHNELVSKMQENQEMRTFYQKYFELNSVLEDKIYEIMKVSDKRENHRLDILFQEYSDVMKGLILDNKSVFERDAAVVGSSENIDADKAQQLMKQLANTARVFSTSIIKRYGGKL